MDISEIIEPRKLNLFQTLFKNNDNNYINEWRMSVYENNEIIVHSRKEKGRDYNRRTKSAADPRRIRGGLSPPIIVPKGLLPKINYL